MGRRIARAETAALLAALATAWTGSAGAQQGDQQFVDCNEKATTTTAAAEFKRAREECLKRPQTDFPQCIGKAAQILRAAPTPSPQETAAALAACLDGHNRRMALRQAIGASQGRISGIGTSDWLEGATPEQLDRAASSIRSDGVGLRATADSDPNGQVDGVKDLGAKAADALDALASSVEKAVDEEKACRLDKKCMAARAENKFGKTVVQPLCEAIWGAHNAELMIAQEKANPAGVVDLVELHNQGDALRYWRQQIAAFQAMYKKTRGHNLARWQNEPACVQEAATPQP
jgi:hypothetical protein